MKSLRYKGTPEHLKTLQEEYRDSGYQTEIVDGWLIVHYGKQPRKQKKGKQQGNSEKWSKRERDFGYTRG